MGWGSAGAGPLDLFKNTVGEGGIRSPMLIPGPGVKGGRQVDAFAYIWNIMPTILELADVPHPEKYQGRQVVAMRGKSLSGVLTGTPTGPSITLWMILEKPVILPESNRKN